MQKAIDERLFRHNLIDERIRDMINRGIIMIDTEGSARSTDEGIEILTGVPAGERQKDGAYPRGTVNYIVDKRLKEMAEQLKGFYTEEKKESK